MSKADEFDKWFKSTYPEYCCGEATIEPYYSIASYACECAEQKQEKRIEELKSELAKKTDTNHSLVEQMADLESENAELEKENNKLLDVINNQDVKIADLEQQIEKMKKYIFQCWHEEWRNHYSNYYTNCKEEFKGLLEELRQENKENE